MMWLVCCSRAKLLDVVVAQLHRSLLLRVIGVPCLYIIPVQPVRLCTMLPQWMRVRRAVTLLVLPRVGRDDSLEWGLGLTRRLEVHRLGKLGVGHAIWRLRNLTDLHARRLDQVTHLCCCWRCHGCVPRWTLGLSSCPILKLNLRLITYPILRWDLGLTTYPIMRWNLGLTSCPIRSIVLPELTLICTYIRVFLRRCSIVLGLDILRERHPSVLPILVPLSSEGVLALLRLLIDDGLCFLDDVAELAKVARG